MDTCDIWNGFSVKEKEKRVKCKKHPFAKNHTTESCPFSNITKCRICSGTCHHFLLCPRRKASTNSTITKTMTSKTNLLPVMVQTAFVKTPKGVGLGAMFDLCSTDHYITHKKAKKLGCKGQEVELIVEGIKGWSTQSKPCFMKLLLLIRPELLIPTCVTDLIRSLPLPLLQTRKATRKCARNSG